jgi:hypothetical protein
MAQQLLPRRRRHLRKEGELVDVFNGNRNAQFVPFSFRTLPQRSECA